MMPMRTTLLAFLLACGMAISLSAAAAPVRSVTLPTQDFPAWNEKAAKVKCLYTIADGRQVLELQNGMAFVTMTDERLPETLAKGTVLGVAFVGQVSTDPDRLPYLFYIGEGRGRPQIGAYRFR